MPRPLAQNALMKPLVALAVPGMYLVYKYNQYKRQQQEASKRKAAEKELLQLNHKIDKLLNKLDEHEPEMAMTQEEECVICVYAKATMQTFPCGHRVVCRKCFVKTIQVAVSQRLLPLRCVVCRAKILRLRQARDVSFPTSVSQYSMAAISASSRCMPTSISLYSFGSGSSGISGISNVSSASSNSGGSYYSSGIRGKLSRQMPTNNYSSSSKRLHHKKVSSKSGARSKEPPLKGIPQIQIEEYRDIPYRPQPVSRPPRVHIRENKVAPQESLGRLPTIKEYTEFISDKEFEKEKSSSTRIRCAQKLVSQIEHHQHGVPPSRGRSPRGSSSSPSPSPARSHLASSSAVAAGMSRGTNRGSGRTLQARVLPRSPSSSPGIASNSCSSHSTRSSPSGRKSVGATGRRESTSSAASMRSTVSQGSISSMRSSTSAHSNISSKSVSPSVRSVSSVKSSSSIKSSASRYGSTSSGKGGGANASSSKSSASAKSAESNRNISSVRKDSEGKGVRRKDMGDGKCATYDKRSKTTKGESKIKALKKRFEGKEYHRLQ